jgi:hypothetical protein
MDYAIVSRSGERYVSDLPHIAGLARRGSVRRAFVYGDSKVLVSTVISLLEFPAHFFRLAFRHVIALSGCQFSLTSVPMGIILPFSRTNSSGPRPDQYPRLRHTLSGPRLCASTCRRAP